MVLTDQIPLPFRVVLLISLISWFWCLVVVVCERRGIQVNKVFKFETTTAGYGRYVTLSGVSLLVFLLYSTFHNYDDDSLSPWDFIPLLLILWCVYYLVSTSKRLRTTAIRDIKGGINRDIRTNDIVFSDTLTSCSKILVDCAIYVCHLLNGVTCLPKSSGPKLDRRCGQNYLLDSIVGSLPNLIRISQCLTEWRVTNDSQHIGNFFKYCSNLPMVMINVLIQYNYNLNSIWVLFAVVNSCYTFYWDLVNDWALFKRQRRFLYPKKLYLVVVLYDLFGRFIWIAKFFKNDILFHTENGWFYLELIELFRRWLWILVKLEVDYITMEKDFGSGIPL